MKFLAMIMCFILGQISYKMIHKCDFSEYESEKIKSLTEENKIQDSLLRLWINDYAWRIRVVSGVEKDTLILKYQKWNPANKIMK